jgi:hypothetical protein
VETRFTRCASLWKETTSVSPTTCQEIRPRGHREADWRRRVHRDNCSPAANKACARSMLPTAGAKRVGTLLDRDQRFGPKGLTRTPEWDKVPISLREGPSMARQIHPTEPTGGLTTTARRRMGRIRYCGRARWPFVRAAGRAAEVLADAYHARGRSATIPSRLPMPNRPSLSAPSGAEVREPCGTHAGLPDETKRAWLKASSPSLPLRLGGVDVE